MSPCTARKGRVEIVLMSRGKIYEARGEGELLMNNLDTKVVENDRTRVRGTW